MLTPIPSFSLKNNNINKLSMTKAAYSATKIAPLDQKDWRAVEQTCIRKYVI
jgi:hypothetical protein